MSRRPSYAPQRILAAATDLFAAQGYEATTMQQIASKAKVSKGLAHHHFQNKQNLLLTIMLAFYKEQYEALREARDRSDDPRQQLHDILEAFVRHINANPQAPRITQRLSPYDPDVVEAMQSAQRPLHRLVLDKVSELVPEQGAHSARQLMMSFIGIAQYHITHGQLLAPLFEGDAYTPDIIDERLQHLHWMVDAVLDRVEAGREGS